MSDLSDADRQWLSVMVNSLRRISSALPECRSRHLIEKAAALIQDALTEAH